MTVLRYPDGEALARAAAGDFVAGAAAGDRFAVALTGGASPRRLYALLADPAFSARIPWDRVHLFWGDERAVPPGHPRSNFGMAERLLLSRVPIPPANIHRIRGELPPVDAANAYRTELASFFDGAVRFDLVYLGLGADGHIASLFPFDIPRLTEQDDPVATSVRRPEGEARVTLTLAALNGSTRVEFLIPSSDKLHIAGRVLRGPLDPFRIPAQGVRPANGELVWRMIDPPVAGGARG